MRALLVLLLLTATAHAEKNEYWAAKQEKRKPLRKLDRSKLVGKKPAKVIAIFNGHTDEWYAVDAKAKSLPQADVDRLLRCHFTNEPTSMDRRLGGLLLDAARHFGASKIMIVSGYRAPKYNLMLRKKGRRVARDSEHTHGNAVDFWLPGVTTDALHEYVMKKQVGGVGKYPTDGFIHIDTGRKRSWIDP